MQKVHFETDKPGSPASSKAKGSMKRPCCSLAEGSSKANPEQAKVQKKLLIAFVLCCIFIIGEVIGGYFAHSVSILSDALHMSADAANYGASLFAAWAVTRKAHPSYTFGYHRLEVVMALFSVCIIWVVVGSLVMEAIERLSGEPQEVNGKVMFFIAIAAICFNLLLGWILGDAHDHHHHHHHDHHHHHEHKHDHAHDHSKKGPSKVISTKHGSYEKLSSHDSAVSMDEDAVINIRVDARGASQKQHPTIVIPLQKQDRSFSLTGQEMEDPSSRSAAQQDTNTMLSSNNTSTTLANMATLDGTALRARTGSNPAAVHTESDHGDDSTPKAKNAASKKSFFTRIISRPKDSSGGSNSDIEEASGLLSDVKHAEYPATQTVVVKHHAGHQSMSLRFAVLHVIGDLMQSIGVAIAGLVVWIHQDNPKWHIADPICTFMFAGMVLMTTFGIVKDVINTLMERAPDGVDPEDVRTAIAQIPGVTDVQDLHVWSLAPGTSLCTVALDVDAQTAPPGLVQAAVQEYLHEEFDIEHCTVQINNL